VKETDDDVNIKNPNEVFSFTSIKDLRNLPADIWVDFIGVVVELEAPDEINLKSGRTKPVWRVRFADNSDESGLSIQVTFWGDISRKLNFKKGDVIALKGIKVGDYNGKSLNVSDENLMTTAYKGREFEVLTIWAEKNFDKLEKLKCLTEK